MRKAAHSILKLVQPSDKKRQRFQCFQNGVCSIMYERWKNEWQIEKEKKIGWAKNGSLVFWATGLGHEHFFLSPMFPVLQSSFACLLLLLWFVALPHFSIRMKKLRFNTRDSSNMLMARLSKGFNIASHNVPERIGYHSAPVHHAKLHSENVVQVFVGSFWLCCYNMVNFSYCCYP